MGRLADWKEDGPSKAHPPGEGHGKNWAPLFHSTSKNFGQS